MEKSALRINNSLLIFSLFLVIFLYTLSNMSAPYIVSELGGSTETSTYPLAIFSIGFAVGLPLADYFAKNFGTVRSLTLFLVLLFFSTIACPLMPNYPMFLIARFIQGIIAGPIFPIVQGLIATFNTPENRPKVLTYIVILSTLGPVLGASYGGWLAYDHNWQLSFYSTAPLLLFCAYGIHIRLKNYETQIQSCPFKLLPYALFSIGITAISLVLTLGQQLDWHRSYTIVSLAIAGIICLIFYLLKELSSKDPLLDIKLLKIPNFTYGLCYLGGLFSSYFGMVILMGLWLNLYVRYTPLWIALILIQMGIAGVFLIFYIDRKLKKMDSHYLLAIALFFFAVSSFRTSDFNVIVSFQKIAFSRILLGFGVAFFLTPLFRLCFGDIPEDKMRPAAILFQMVRSLSSGVGAVIYSTMWYRRQVFFHERLNSHLTEFSDKTHHFFSTMQKNHLTGKAADAELENLLTEQATALALADCFYFMAWLSVALFIVLAAMFFWNKYKKRKLKSVQP